MLIQTVANYNKHCDMLEFSTPTPFMVLPRYKTPVNSVWFAAGVLVGAAKVDGTVTRQRVAILIAGTVARFHLNTFGEHLVAPVVQSGWEVDYKSRNWWGYSMNSVGRWWRSIWNLYAWWLQLRFDPPWGCIDLEISSWKVLAILQMRWRRWWKQI